MKVDGLLIAIAAVLLIVGGIAGYALCGWTTPDPPSTVVTPQAQTHQVADTAGQAAVYAAGFTDGRASVRPSVRTITVAGATHTEVVYDSTSLAAALEAYNVIDSLLTSLNTVQDLIAHSVMDLPEHRLELFYRVRERSFRGTSITCMRPDTARVIKIPEAQTWWDRWSVGLTAGPGVYYIPGAGVRLGAGLTIGVQYAF